MSYLYILPSVKRPAFKIGITDDIFTRSEYFEQINWDLAKAFEGSRKSVLNAEKMLHAIFFCDRLPTDGSSGGSEWFNISCYEQALTVLMQHADRMLLKTSPIISNVHSQNATSSRLNRRSKKPPTYTHVKPHLIYRLAVISLLICRRNITFLGISSNDIEPFPYFRYMSPAIRSIEFDGKCRTLHICINPRVVPMFNHRLYWHALLWPQYPRTSKFQRPRSILKPEHKYHHLAKLPHPC